MKSEDLKEIYNKAKEIAIAILQQAYLTSWNKDDVDNVCIEDDGTIIVKLSHDMGCRGTSDIENEWVSLTEEELNQPIETTVEKRRCDNIAKLAKEAETKRIKEEQDKKKAEEAKAKKEYSDYLKLKDKYETK